jgi:hypothetical protein
MMVPTSTARIVLNAVAMGLPETEHSFINGLDMHWGYGDAVHVRLRTVHPETVVNRKTGGALRQAVADALVGQNHTVFIRWSSA